MTLLTFLWAALQSGASVTISTPPSPATAFRSVVPVIYVQDVRRSAAFYRDILAFELRSFTVGAARAVTKLAPADDPYAADFAVGEQSIALQQASNVRASGTRLDIVVDDLTAYHQRLARLGVKMYRFTKSTDGRVFCFSVLDPDHHEILFLQRQETTR